MEQVYLNVFACMQLVPNLIDDADVHRVCMQIDSAVEFVLLFVELHHVLP